MYKARRTHLDRLQAVVDDIKHELPEAQRAPVQAAADVLIHIAQPSAAVSGQPLPPVATTAVPEEPRPTPSKPSVWTQAASAVVDTYEQKKKQYNRAKTMSGFMNSDFSFF